MATINDNNSISRIQNGDEIAMKPTHCVVAEVLTKDLKMKRMVIMFDKDDHWNDQVCPFGQIDEIVSLFNGNKLSFMERKNGMGHNIKVYKLVDNKPKDLKLGYCARIYTDNDRKRNT